MKRILLLAILLGWVGAAIAQKNHYTTIPYTPFYKFNQEIEDKIKRDTVPWKHRLAASAYANKGDYKNALIQWGKGRRGRSLSARKKDSIRALYKTVPAVNYITKKAKNHQIVIINEQHHSARHRFFTKSLLKKLYKQGYRYLGLEALRNGVYRDSLLIKRKYPISKTGYYITDPQFGNLVRLALEIGYETFSYEYTQRGSGKPREIGQAKNIAQFIKTHPKGKFLIHCGYDHALEGNHPRPKWEKAMAARLTEYTSMDPLTINQPYYAETNNPAANSYILQSLNLQKSSVLFNTSGKPIRYQRRKAYTDLVVLHPVTKYQNERPDWLFEGKNKKVKLTLNDLDISFPAMVLAFKEGEDILKAVPMDLIELARKDQTGYLALPKGKYEVVVVNAQKEARKFKLKVR